MQKSKKRLKCFAYLPAQIEALRLAAENGEPKAAEIAAQREEEYRALIAYMQSIDDARISTAMRLRYAERMRWAQIAALTGDSENAVKMACDRYAEKHPIQIDV